MKLNVKWTDKIDFEASTCGKAISMKLNEASIKNCHEKNIMTYGP